MDEHIFISHASKNDDIVKKLRETLEFHGQLTWVDSRELSGGDELEASIPQTVSLAFIAELLLELTNPCIVEQDGAHRAQATAKLTYHPVDDNRPISSRQYTFKAPIGLISRNRSPFCGSFLSRISARPVRR